VTRIDSNHLTAYLLTLVGDEIAKLAVTPGVMSSPLPASALLGAAENAGEIFDNDYAAWFHALNNSLA
jgi:hypothetical protein